MTLPVYATDADVPNVFTPRTTILSSEVNANFESLEDSINRDQHFYAVDYSTDSDTGGIVEAYEACVAANGGTVVVPNGVTNIDGSDLTDTMITFDTDEKVCNVIGYGSPGIILDTDPVGGSILRFTNSAGIEVFRVLDSGVHIGRLALYFVGADATTTGIYCGETNNVVIDNVNMESDGAAGTGSGIGIDMWRCLKAVVRDTETFKFAIGLRVDSYSNATGAYNSRFRGGGLGVHIAGTDTAIGETFTLADVTIEGNERGMLVDNAASQHLVLLNAHFEQTTGTLASRYNIRITSTGGFQMNMLGGTLGGTVPADRDYYRTSSSGVFGPDVMLGVTSHNGMECSSSCDGLNVSGARKLTHSTGSVFMGADLYDPSDCPAAIIAFFEAPYGMTCAEPDGDVWQCRDLDHASGTDDESCDHADEIVKLSSGSEAETTSDPTDGSTACETGDKLLNTSNQKMFWCVNGATDDWYGVQLTDSP